MWTFGLQTVRHPALIAAVAWLCLSVPAIVRAADWTSPDGVVAVTVPAPERFTPIEPAPEPFLVLWMSEDESVRLCVLRTPIPARAKLNRKEVEASFTNEFGGTLTASSSSIQNGHEVLFMTATGALQGVPALMSQAVLRHEDFGYKVMAARMGDTAGDPAMDAFVKSVRVAKPGSGEPFETGNRPRRPIDLNDISGKIGAAGVLLIVVVVALQLSRRGKKSERPPDIR